MISSEYVKVNKIGTPLSVLFHITSNARSKLHKLFWLWCREGIPLLVNKEPTLNFLKFNSQQLKV